MTEATVNIPEIPAGWNAPEKVKKQWRQAYVEAFAQAKRDHPDDEATQRQAALREANRIFRKEVTSYEQAVALEDWEVLHRKEVDGVLGVVTVYGRKYFFDVPAKGRRVEEPKKEEPKKEEPKKD